MSDSRSRPDLTIRRAVEADWPSLWPIWHDVVRAGDTYVYAPDTPEDQARAGWLGTDPAVETWLAEKGLAEKGLAETGPSAGGTVLGMYKIEPNHAGPGAHVANGSYMVAAAARGTGAGRALVEHSLRRCTELGYLAIQFNAVAETNVGAIMLYERLGFHTVGTVPEGFRHPHRGLVGLRIMHRPLR